MSYSYMCMARDEIKKGTRPERIIYWAYRWHNQKVWDLTGKLAANYRDLYGKASDGNTLALRRCVAIAPNLQTKMVKHFEETLFDWDLI